MKAPAANHHLPLPGWVAFQTDQMAPDQAKINGASGVGPTPKATYVTVRFRAARVQNASRRSAYMSRIRRAQIRFQPSDHSTDASLMPNVVWPNTAVVSAML